MAAHPPTDDAAARPPAPRRSRLLRALLLAVVLLCVAEAPGHWESGLSWIAPASAVQHREGDGDQGPRTAAPCDGVLRWCADGAARRPAAVQAFDEAFLDALSDGESGRAEAAYGLLATAWAYGVPDGRS